nr:tyrosine-type recombinase/integrase [uncultured Sellimonas sp.]
MGNTGNPDNKELVIHSIITAMSPSLDGEELRRLDDILREKLHGIKLEEECTELSTWNDDNEYIVKIFLANKKLIGCKEGSLEQYALSLKQFFSMIDKNYRDVKKDDIKYFLAVRSGEVQHNTLANIKSNLSSFFTFLHDEGYIPMNPIKPIKIKRVDVENIHLTVDEEVAVRDVKKSLRDEALVDFLFSTGVRVGELAAMDISNVDFAAGTVTFRGEKSDRFRTVILDARAKRHLAAYLNSRADNNPALFVTERLYDGQPRRLKKDAIENITKAVGRAAGLHKVLTVHVFRRTLATRLADKECPLEVVQEILGHRSPTTTKRYIAQNQARIRRQAVKYMDAA